MANTEADQPVSSSSVGNEESPSATKVDDQVSLRSALNSLQADLEALRQRVTVKDEEIAALQVESARRSRKWYREPAILISLFALIATILATVLTQASVAADRENQQRARLTDIIQQIDTSLAAPKQGNEYYAQAVQMRLLANEAVSLINKVDSAPYEQLVVSAAYIFTGDYDKSLDVAKHAESMVQSVTDRVSVNRTIGEIYFKEGSFPEGRQALSRAAEDASGSDLTPEAKVRFDFENEFFWAGQELWARNCVQARDRTQAARVIAASAPQVLIKAYQSRVDELQRQVGACG